MSGIAVLEAVDATQPDASIIVADRPDRVQRDSIVEEQETAFLSDLQELAPRQAALDKAEKAMEAEEEKLAKRTAAVAAREAQSKLTVEKREAAAVEKEEAYAIVAATPLGELPNNCESCPPLQ